ncbi:hypothetical protein EV191_11041 [Tamaricihabitans halophyticus]|uniref:DSBA-like thioredoxin domain-containing protein n=1 Tax=Tamaricihabitans halophyticus TaxID=1262583 RepID=A0A4R2QII5_9PSEU|nr:disulfide bond formation protein DsbA [Tamaricihabitans halophyticus]TCP48484.1 hypothetical protein EV191_11041 [Tamaricihabitans halophyticus]
MSTVPEPATSDGPWTVDFWLDPACPLTRNTARWLELVARELAIEVHWRIMSLSILNEHREVDPEGDEEGYLWIPARIGAAVRHEHGSAALRSFYWALWTEPDGTEREWLGDLEEALHRGGLPTALAGAGWSTDYDTVLRASHQDAVGRIEAEVGTPILALSTATGEPHTIFGPVLSNVPEPAEAIRIWQACTVLAAAPSFRELKH